MYSKIAIIDDDPDVVAMIEMILRNNGYETRSYGDEQDIVEKLRSYLPSLILLDIHMPSKNGIEVLKDIKKDPVLKKIPVVMLTVEGNPSEIQLSLLSGANTYILKPAKEKDILEVVRSLLVV